MSSFSKESFPSFFMDPFFMVPIASTITPLIEERDPETVHPASIIPLSEMADLTEKVAQKRIEEIHPASIPSPIKLIRDGYGELVLRVRDRGELRPVTEEEYAKAYLIFQKYAPRLEENPRPLTKSRIEMMREELQTINPNMVATFIPRTLYELIFIRESIQEDVLNETRFTYENPNDLTADDKRQLGIRLSQNSWFMDPMRAELESGRFPKIEIRTPLDVKKHLPTLIDVGYRLNLAACSRIDRIGANIEDLSLDQIQALVDEQLEFLENFEKYPVLDGRFFYAREASPLTRFFCDFSGRQRKTNSQENIIGLRKIAFIECQESMAKKLLCYRGGSLATDSPVKKITAKNEDAYSISFGSAPFSGIVNDIGACAYNHMFELHDKGKEDAYILVLDPAQESAQTFHTPVYTALESLFGNGETWHYRFKNSKDEDRIIAGFWPSEKDFEPGVSPSQRRDFLKGPLSVQQTIDKFDDLKKKNIILICH